MPDKLIKFEIVTPERTVLKEDILQISVTTKNGEITVLPNHLPLVATLAPGVIEIRKPGNEIEVMSISGGFIEVLKDKIVVLADTAERAEEIDIIRAEVAHKKAVELMKQERQIDHLSFARTNALIEKELARTKAVKKWKKMKNIINAIGLKK
jgi:F-type H+-transporting ATPase subunit epsilon